MSNKNPSVCIVVDSFYPIVGGGESHARILADELIRDGFHVFVLTRRPSRELSKIDKVGNIPVFRVLPTGINRFGKYLMMLPALFVLFRKRHEYEIIYVCGLRVLGILGVFAAICLNKKCVLRSESCDELKGEHIKGAFKNIVLKAIATSYVNLRNIYIKKANSFIAISTSIKEEYLACNVPLKKIKVIPNGIDTSQFLPATNQEKQNLRHKLALPDKYIFAYSGKLNQGKGLELLLRVGKEMASRYSRVHFLLIGGGGNQFLSCERELKQFVEKESLRESVTFTGYVENVSDYLNAADFFVFPSESEALGISLLEALSCGLPSIGTHSAPVPTSKSTSPFKDLIGSPFSPFFL